MPGDISILKFNNILHWQTGSCLRPALNRRYFTLLISFSSTAASHVAGLSFHLHKFNSPQSLHLSLLVVTTLQFWSSLCQDCCFLEFLGFCPVKPARGDVEFGCFPLLCALHAGQCDGDCDTPDKVQHLCPGFLAVDLQRNQELYQKPMQAKQNFSNLELQQLLINELGPKSCSHPGIHCSQARVSASLDDPFYPCYEGSALGVESEMWMLPTITP